MESSRSSRASSAQGVPVIDRIRMLAALRVQRPASRGGRGVPRPSRALPRPVSRLRRRGGYDGCSSSPRPPPMRRPGSPPGWWPNPACCPGTATPTGMRASSSTPCCSARPGMGRRRCSPASTTVLALMVRRGVLYVDLSANAAIPDPIAPVPLQDAAAALARTVRFNFHGHPARSPSRSTGSPRVRWEREKIIDSVFPDTILQSGASNHVRKEPRMKRLFTGAVTVLLLFCGAAAFADTSVLIDFAAAGSGCHHRDRQGAEREQGDDHGLQPRSPDPRSPTRRRPR